MQWAARLAAVIVTSGDRSARPQNGDQLTYRTNVEVEMRNRCPRGWSGSGEGGGIRCIHSVGGVPPPGAGLLLTSLPLGPVSLLQSTQSTCNLLLSSQLSLT